MGKREAPGMGMMFDLGHEEQAGWCVRCFSEPGAGTVYTDAGPVCGECWEAGREVLEVLAEWGVQG